MIRTTELDPADWWQWTVSWTTSESGSPGFNGPHRSMATSTHQCCTSLSMSSSGHWQHASNYRSLPQLVRACWRLWASTSTACIPTPIMVRHGTCRHNYAVERGLVDGFCGQPLYCNWPYYQIARFWSPSSHMVSAQPFLDRRRPISCKSAQMWSCLVTFLWLWPVTPYEPHSRHMPTNKIIKVDWNYSTKQTMSQSYDWNQQRPQHSRNKWNRQPIRCTVNYTGTDNQPTRQPTHNYQAIIHTHIYINKKQPREKRPGTT